LFNVVKHADCDRAKVELGPGEPGWLRLVVRDQGVGFDTGRLARGETGGTGFGILAMRERLRALGGKCEIDSTPGRGTCVTLAAPLDADSQAGPRDGVSPQPQST
jgi:signal transduction histidine kinase